MGMVLPRTLACLVNEACFAMLEGAAKREDLDTAMKLGTRYPRGPIEWGNMWGPAHVLSTLDALWAEHGDDRYRAAPILRRVVEAGFDRIEWPVWHQRED